MLETILVRGLCGRVVIHPYFAVLAPVHSMALPKLQPFGMSTVPKEQLMTFEERKKHRKDGSSPQMDTCMSHLRHDAFSCVSEPIFWGVVG